MPPYKIKLALFRHHLEIMGTASSIAQQMVSEHRASCEEMSLEREVWDKI